MKMQGVPFQKCAPGVARAWQGENVPGLGLFLAELANPAPQWIWAQPGDAAP